LLNHTIERDGYITKKELTTWVQDYVGQRESLIRNVLVELLEELSFERTIPNADDLIERLNHEN